MDELGYKVNWKVLNAADYGVPQNRKRIYIIGNKLVQPSFDDLQHQSKKLKDVLFNGLQVSSSPFVKSLLKHYTIEELVGKSCKDKRGGCDNIHSWDLELKGKLSKREKNLLTLIMKERRKRKWAAQWGIDWMDGMPLSKDMIKTFANYEGLEKDLNDCVNKNYLKYEHPKKLINDGNGATHREEDTKKPYGYNIVSGKMSFEVNKILDPNDIAPTLVAMDMGHLFVPDNNGIRPLTLREGLRLFGYPDDYKFDIGLSDGYDLLGNTVVVPVIKQVSEKVLDCIPKGEIFNENNAKPII